MSRVLDVLADTRIAKLPLTGGALTGALFEKSVVLAANDINLSLGGMFSKTITTATTFTLSNVPVSGTASSFILELTDAGAFTVTWFAGIKWAGGIAPTMTAAGVDILGFYTRDGVTWRGMFVSKDSK